ncbi:methyltransferase domain-containing protein [Streptomyces sp. NPDC049906]|uniref:methyltransferase domain-containing protein n=1 Tax=Streptomyces sp. NPDC049906 TaxID=3155656 RepID=UPI00342F7032
MTPVTAPPDELRHRMVERLVRDGALRSPAWCAAFEAVPRELFVSTFTTRAAGEPIAYREGDPGYLEAVYTDSSLNTQYDVHGTATSSSSQPTVMALMLEALAPADDSLPVLDLGTGPGYNAALLSHRYGSPRVVSRDVDPALVDAAAEHLAAAGCAPTLTVGDGNQGCPEHAPYGALIATYGVGRVPAPWRTQVVRGGTIVANVGNGLVSLTVGDHGLATGRFLPVLAAFMTVRAAPGDAPTPARAHAGRLATAEGEGREIELTVALDEGMPRFLGALSQPDVLELSLLFDERRTYGLVHPDSQSWARITPHGDGTASLVRGGPRDLWTERAPLLSGWNEAGRPGPDAYGLTVHPDGMHELTLGEAVSWSLQ